MKYLEFDLKKTGDYQPKLCAYVADHFPEINLNRRRPAVIICPGGGYEMKSNREAEPVALQYLAKGMNAFVLQYSVSPARFPTAALELAQAVMLVRSRAEEWYIDPKRIVVLGFSAGGHLAGTLGTLWNCKFFADALGQEKTWRPDGMALCYPVITMGEYTHEGSRNALLGPGASKDAAEALSLEKQVRRDTVPAFLWHTQEDGLVPVENSLFYACALRRNGVPFEMHIYEKGDHGLSLCAPVSSGDERQIVPDNQGWLDLSARWIERLGEGEV